MRCRGKTAAGLLALGALLSAAPAAASAATGISGTVTVGGLPTGGISVCAFDADLNGPPQACSATDGSGKYELEVNAGEHKVQFSSTAAPGVVREYYDEKSNLEGANRVVVNEGEVTGGIDADLVAGGAFTGKVTGPSGEALEKLQVCAMPSANPFGPATECQPTDSSGEYTLLGLPAGSYLVQFQNRTCDSGVCHPLNFVSEYYDNAKKVADAQALSLVGGETRGGIGAQLEEGATLSGTVKDASTTKPIEGLQVCTADGPNHVTDCRTTDAEGNYEFVGLAPGEYRVLFTNNTTCGPEGCAHVNYVPQYYEDKSTYSGATPIPLASGDVKHNVSASMQPGGSIAGTVVDNEKEPLPGISVCVNERTGAFGECTKTDAEGHYKVIGLPAGEYRIGFASGGGGGFYLEQFWNHRPTFNEADFLPVSSGQAKAGIDGELQEGGAIAGTVLNSGKTPIPGLQVCANEPTSQFQSRNCSQTNSSGEYRILLPEGGYKVQFTNNVCNFEGCHNQNYVRQWYEGTTDFGTATTVPVAKGATHSGVDATMQSGASISGTVTVAGDGPLEGIQVCAQASSGPEPGFNVECTQTNGSGQYSLAGLPAGSYKVQFNNNSCGPEGCVQLNYVPQYWNGVEGFEEADVLTLAAGEARANVDAVMEEGGGITGTVRDVGGEPIPHIGVCVQRTGSGEFVGCAQTKPSGEYSLAGLKPGSYIVSFQGNSCGFEGCFNSNFVRRYWREADKLRDATPVELEPGEIEPGIDAVLEEGATVSGHVADEAGEPVVNEMVCAHLAGPEEEEGEGGGGGCTNTDEHGDYELSGLAAGGYRIEFSATRCGPEGCKRTNYVRQYYNGQTEFAKAKILTLSAGDTEAGIDAVLEEGATVSGRVTDEEGEPIQHVGVCALPPGAAEGEEAPVDCAQTDSAGEYALPGIPAGEYFIHFSNQSCGEEGCFEVNYVQQYWQGSDTIAGAELIPLAKGDVEGGIDAVLKEGAEVSGKVTEIGGGPIPRTQVCLQTASGEYLEGVGCGQTDEEGEYKLAGIPAGEYKVEFSGQSCDEEGCRQLNFVRQYYDEKPDFNHADVLTLAAGDRRGGIDAVLEEGGSISGAVIDASTEEPIGGLEVCANPMVEEGEEEPEGRCERAAPDGGYRIVGLASGDYRVEFSNRICPVEGEGEEECEESDYVRQYFDGQSRWEDADPVSVTVGHEHEVVGAEMERGGSISGTVVRLSGGAPVAGLEVCANPTEGEAPGECGRSDESGAYVIHGLRAGDYTVEFTRNVCNGEECETSYLVRQFFDDKTNPGDANPVEVTADHTRPNVDAAMDEGGAISGIATDVLATPLEGVSVCAFEVGGSGEPVECEGTGPGGSYRLYVPTGSFKVEFSLPEYVTQFYSGKSSLEAANAVTVTAGDTSGGVGATLAHAAPVNTEAPTLTGTPALGQTLSCSQGAWDNTPTSFAYAWKRDGSTISGQSGSEYTVEDADRGFAISCEVTATNAGGSATAASNSLQVPPRPPVNTTAPSLTGTPAPGEDLSCSTGSWDNSPTSYAYAWKRDGSPIGGQAQSEYTVQNADRGHGISCEVTATNAGGSGTAVSNTLQVPPPAPVNTTPPALTGTPIVGQALSCSQGAWDNSPTAYAYAWKRDGSPIGGQAQSEYTVQNADRGHGISCEVTATNTGGSGMAVSNTLQVPPPPPVNTAAPALTGTPSVGQALSCSNGVWENAPTSYAYGWRRDGTTIGGQAASTYTVQSADRGHGISCEVTATNAGGSGTALSNAVQVPPPAPVNTTAPALTGTPSVGQALSCSNGVWENAPTSFAYAWNRDGAPLAGQVGATYTVQSADQGHGIACAVTAGNAGGSATAGSNVLQIPAAPEPPKQAGVAYAGSTAKVKGGKAQLSLTCKGETPCNGVAKLYVGKTQIGKASFSIAAGTKKTVSAKLSSKGMSKLRKAGKKGLVVQLKGTGLSPRKLTLKQA